MSLFTNTRITWFSDKQGLHVHSVLRVILLSSGFPYPTPPLLTFTSVCVSMYNRTDPRTGPQTYGNCWTFPKLHLLTHILTYPYISTYKNPPSFNNNRFRCVAIEEYRVSTYLSRYH